jgi:diguanylate cyclase (GGDEF)-like protein
VSDEASRLRALVEVARLRAAGGGEDWLAHMAEATARAMAYRTVVVNLYRRAWDDFEAACVHGSDEVRSALLHQSMRRSAWRDLLHPRFLSHGVYHIPHGTFDWGRDDASWVPRAPIVDAPGAWHPEDALFAPMRGPGGALLGVLSVDEPLSGRRPGPGELEILGAVAAHAGVVLGAAQEAEIAQRHKAALDQLLRVSVGLGVHGDVDAMLRDVCHGVREALGFERAAVLLADEPGGDRLAPRAQVGWDADEPLVGALSRRRLAPFLRPRFERDGCHLASGATVSRLLGPDERLHDSRRNGRGPHAWRHHWLLVPLLAGDGELLGVLWADDPVDRLLPSRERLQALRVFANQAAAALESARQTRMLRHLAEHDPLTGLRNRRGLTGHIDARIAAAHPPSAVLVCDLDHFKRVNDLRGHEVGDRALSRFGALLRQEARPGDLAVRLGGEEFALVLAGADADGGLAAAERLRAATRERFGSDLPELTVSIGVAMCGRDGDTAEAVLAAADTALNAAKRLGRDRCLAFDAELVARVMAGARDHRADLLAPVLRLAEAVDLRRASGGRHARTVGGHAELLARRLGWAEERVERMRIAGLLHDVGNVGVPDTILDRRGPLDAGGRAAVRRHCELGGQIVEGAGLGDVAGWVRTHHERPDGRGYPRGLAGDAIAIEARILAVADAFEAMTADRPYRAALGLDRARAELRRGAAAGQFDPELVELFLAALAEAAPAHAGV